MARIKFERSGGFLEPPLELSLDLDTLYSDEAQHFMHLIEDADLFHLPENIGAAPDVDEFLYTITVEAGDIQHRIRVSEMSVPESLWPLINGLSAITAFG